MSSLRAFTLSRNKLTAFFKDFELVKFIENISLDVTGALPEGTAQALAAAQAAQGTADEAQQRAGAAHLGIFGQQIAHQALGAAQGAQRTADDAQSLAAALALGIYARPQAASTQVAANDAQNILANRIFGR